MRQVLRVAADLLAEALRRRWFLGLFGAITAVLVGLGLSLELEVVDGAIAGSKLFGELFTDEILSADRVLTPLYLATAYVGFYGGTFFLAIACSDFAVELLAPGRIEHLLSLPVTRFQLLLGTYLGVVTLGLLSVLYGAVGVVVLLGSKTGLWNGALLEGALVGWVGFCAVYAAMLASAFFVRSAALSAAVGLGTLVLGVVSSEREAIAALFEPGVRQGLFRVAVTPFPRLATLATTAAHLSTGLHVPALTTAKLLAGALLFAASLLLVAVYRFERQNF
jgi:Cu-processing system permease protein